MGYAKLSVTIPEDMYKEIKNSYILNNGSNETFHIRESGVSYPKPAAKEKLNYEGTPAQSPGSCIRSSPLTPN